MINSNYCVGCRFAGTVGGYEPECNCCKKDAAIIASIESNEAAVDMLEYVDELLPDTKQCNTTRQNKRKARRMQRRIAAKKYARKVPERLTIVNAKLDRLPANASSDDLDVAIKKCFNADKKAIYGYQTVISIELAELPKNFKFGQGLEALILRISNLDASADINILETAMSNDGQLVGLHCERCERDDDGKKRNDDAVDVLHVKIGFRDKVSLLDFIRRTAA